MLLAARRTLEFAAGLDFSAFQRSDLHQQAIARTLSIIGEAARRVSDETKNRHPEIRWAQIVGLRHRIVHDYFRLDLVRIWDIVQHDVGRLIAALEPLVPPEESGGRA
jgi:uncharacterized protein with HEPN domain